ncbi:sulfotransferase domain-containing protein [Reichenbachiella sp. MALMAid0571]|uniref:sulfotransferase domain-containing protein n=1 Tax=Reichenbachiella sp. MALMAid0571 TaxID=3143939 RepID=UPI0032DFCA38
MNLKELDLIPVAIHSVPRSGSTWLGAIFDSHPKVAYRFQPLFSYGHKGQISERSGSADIDIFFKDILETKDQFVLGHGSPEKAKVPKFTKELPSHIVYKEVRYHHIIRNLLNKNDEIKVVALIRDPIEVIHSWLKAPKEFRYDLGWNADDEWYYAKKKNQNKPEEFNGFAKWIEVASTFEQLRNEFPDRVFIINYKNLVDETVKTVKQAFDFCQLELVSSVREFIHESKSKESRDPYGVYKTKSTSSYQIDRIGAQIMKELKNTTLEKYLLV